MDATPIPFSELSEISEISMEIKSDPGRFPEAVAVFPVRA
jgi:hypothetical protein